MVVHRNRLALHSPTQSPKLSSVLQVFASQALLFRACVHL